MSVGSRISDLRREHNISQGQLAKLLDISRQAVSKWENDQTSPDTLNLIKLADVLETEVEYLATGHKPVYQPAPIVINLVEKPDRAVVKEVPKRIIVKQKPHLNPVYWSAFAGFFFVMGLLLGLLL